MRCFGRRWRWISVRQGAVSRLDRIVLSRRRRSCGYLLSRRNDSLQATLSEKAVAAVFPTRPRTTTSAHQRSTAHSSHLTEVRTVTIDDLAVDQLFDPPSSPFMHLSSLFATHPHRISNDTRTPPPPTSTEHLHPPPPSLPLAARTPLPSPNVQPIQQCTHPPHASRSRTTSPRCPPSTCPPTYPPTHPPPASPPLSPQSPPRTRPSSAPHRALPPNRSSQTPLSPLGTTTSRTRSGVRARDRKSRIPPFPGASSTALVSEQAVVLGVLVSLLLLVRRKVDSVLWRRAGTGERFRMAGGQ